MAIPIDRFGVQRLCPLLHALTQLFQNDQTGSVDSTFIQRASHSSSTSSSSHMHLNSKQDSTSESGALLLVTRCLAFLYFFYQFKSLYKHGSKYLVGITGSFTIVSSCIFTSTVINVLKKDFSELKYVYIHWPILFFTIL